MGEDGPLAQAKQALTYYNFLLIVAQSYNVPFIVNGVPRKRQSASDLITFVSYVSVYFFVVQQTPLYWVTLD